MTLETLVQPDKWWALRVCSHNVSTPQMLLWSMRDVLAEHMLERADKLLSPCRDTKRYDGRPRKCIEAYPSSGRAAERDLYDHGVYNSGGVNA